MEIDIHTFHATMALIEGKYSQALEKCVQAEDNDIYYNAVADTLADVLDILRTMEEVAGGEK